MLTCQPPLNVSFKHLYGTSLQKLHVHARQGNVRVCVKMEAAPRASSPAVRLWSCTSGFRGCLGPEEASRGLGIGEQPICCVMLDNAPETACYTTTPQITQ